MYLPKESTEAGGTCRHHHRYTTWQFHSGQLHVWVICLGRGALYDEYTCGVPEGQWCPAASTHNANMHLLPEFSIYSVSGTLFAAQHLQKHACMGEFFVGHVMIWCDGLQHARGMCSGFRVLGGNFGSVHQ